MNQQLAIGVAIGVGGMLLIPAVGMMIAAGGARPMGRALVRSGSVLTEKARETVAELCEVYEDFMAEARAGHEEPREEQPTIQTATGLGDVSRKTPGGSPA